MAAARRGLGIALLPHGAIRPELDAGSFVPVLDGVVGMQTPASLVFVDREFLPPRLRLFIDRAVDHFRTQRSLSGEPLD
jgi:DNA-binding transcriptional LysR family regulator